MLSRSSSASSGRSPGSSSTLLPSPVCPYQPTTGQQLFIIIFPKLLLLQRPPGGLPDSGPAVAANYKDFGSQQGLSLGPIRRAGRAFYEVKFYIKPMLSFDKIIRIIVLVSSNVFNTDPAWNEILA